MGAPAALASAVEDALKPLGIKIDSLPIRPVLLREMIREAPQRRTEDGAAEDLQGPSDWSGRGGREPPGARPPGRVVPRGWNRGAQQGETGGGVAEDLEAPPDGGGRRSREHLGGP